MKFTTAVGTLRLRNSQENFLNGIKEESTNFNFEKREKIKMKIFNSIFNFETPYEISDKKLIQFTDQVFDLFDKCDTEQKFVNTAWEAFEATKQYNSHLVSKFSKSLQKTKVLKLFVLYSIIRILT